MAKKAAEVAERLKKRALGKRAKDFGRLYRGREGQWSWLAHRVTGVAIILFLFAHVVDTALVGWGPEAYNRVVAVYHNPFIRLLELGLVAMVMYHALNGTRIMLIDFFPKLSDRSATIFYAMMVLFVGAMVPITYIIGKPVVERLFYRWPSPPPRARRPHRRPGRRPRSAAPSPPGKAWNCGRGCSCASPGSCSSCSPWATS